jgi:hypothetical protein
MRLPLLLASALALAACSSQHAPSDSAQGADARGAQANPATASALQGHRASAIAGLPDHGHLVAYAAIQPVRHSAYTWHAVQISEAHALRALATGTMELEAPDGTPIRLRYARHVEHKDGNWTWVGRPDGAQPGTEAIITFGEKAVFGSVPNGDGPPLRITTAGGRTWMMETDGKAIAKMAAAGMLPQGDDFATPPALAGARDQALSAALASPQKLTASGAVPESATVDVVIGYTNAFASRLGGTSQALTRLNYLVDRTNQAYVNSQIVAQVRLVGAVALNYPDATNNETALRELTGVTCTETPMGLDCSEAPVPAALMPLVNARANLHADLMSLVRNFNDPENESCGIAWLLGGGLQAITPADAYAGVSVVSDSSGNLFPDNNYVCRDETFAHELGHNMGSAHDRTTAMGDNGTLETNENGAYPYSFGYKTTVGNFATIMAYRDAGQTPYLVFSNPRITYCGGNACGVTDQADNARSLGQTAPIIAAFYASLAPTTVPRSDFDADGKSDLVWRNTKSGADQIWLSANSATLRAVTAVPNLSWKIAESGDFNGDGAADLLWRNDSTGQNQIWYSGLSTAAVTLGAAPSPWFVAGVGDFNGDGNSDILWRNPTTGQNSIWRSGNYATPQAMTTVNSAGWSIVAVADFDGDGVSDTLWRNSSTGVNSLWRSANSATTQAVTAVGNLAWTVVGAGDFNGDGLADILWRNASAGTNQIWPSANSALAQTLGAAPNPWAVAGVADFDGDGSADIFWRNGSSGAGSIWRSGNYATSQVVTTVNNPDWVVRS